MRRNEVKHGEIQSVEQLRDELKIQAHLFKTEAKDAWKRLESNWRKLKGQLSPVKRASEKTALEVTMASKLLLKAIKKGYRQIKQSLPG